MVRFLMSEVPMYEGRINLNKCLSFAKTFNQLRASTPLPTSIYSSHVLPSVHLLSMDRNGAFLTNTLRTLSAPLNIPPSHTASGQRRDFRAEIVRKFVSFSAGSSVCPYKIVVPRS